MKRLMDIFRSAAFKDHAKGAAMGASAGFLFGPKGAAFGAALGLAMGADMIVEMFESAVKGRQMAHEAVAAIPARFRPKTI
jgi:hypothetical protein